MKKLLLSLLAVMISFTALAQTKGDKLTKIGRAHV